MKIQKDVQLSDKTTMRVGGPARYFVSIISRDELIKAVEFAREKQLPIFVLGGGSNVLVGDEGFSGLVIQVNMQGITYDGTTVRAEAGENWDAFVEDTIAHGLYGLENLSYIPGTVGACPIQNIGAYGKEVSQYIREVEVFNTETGAFGQMTSDECQFSYRDSIFKKDEGKKYIVVSVTFNLHNESHVDISYKDLQNYFEENSDPTPDEVRNAVIKVRKKKLPDPKDLGTVGSFFKNPIVTKERYDDLRQHYPDLPSYEVDKARVKIPLAWILDNILHLKGFQKGNVRLHDNQPLAIVNVGGATMDEINLFACDVEKKVFEKTNITIEREVREVK